ncbi:MAG: Glyoxalase/bleomycin resistance protein/dioxygenase, partial [uncultured Acidimicrobiales bacterium]
EGKQGVQRVLRRRHRRGQAVLPWDSRPGRRAASRGPHAQPGLRWHRVPLPQARPPAGDFHGPELPGARHRRHGRRPGRGGDHHGTVRRTGSGPAGHRPAGLRPTDRVVQGPSREHPLGDAGV